MSFFANDPTVLILLIGLVLFALVAAFLFWTRPRAEEKKPMETGEQAQISARSSLGDGRTLITVRHGDTEHVLLIGPQTDLLLDSRKIPVKTMEKPTHSMIPMPFPPASDYQRLPPLRAPLQSAPATREQAPAPHQPMPQMPAPQAPAPLVLERTPMAEPMPVYEPLPPVYAPEPVTAPPTQPPHYDNVFQASVQTHHHTLHSPHFPVAEPVAQPQPQPPAREADIAIPAFLQSKISPVMMEQALPPAEALPPTHWPEQSEPEIALANWENTLPPLRAHQDSPPSATDPALDLAARQLEDALRQKLAEVHPKPAESRPSEIPNSGMGHPPLVQPQAHDPYVPPAHPAAQAAPATQTAADAAADRFEQEIRKLLGRDLKKL